MVKLVNGLLDAKISNSRNRPETGIYVMEHGQVMLTCEVVNPSLQCESSNTVLWVT